jgi:hypothetical protein
MPQAPTHIRRQVSPAAVPIVLLACLGLSACGNSSSTGTTAAATTAAATTTTAASASTSTATTAPTPAASATTATSSHTLSPSGSESSSDRPPAQSRAPHFRAAFRHALTAYAACMRHNGVPLPAPDTSGKGPLFKTGINTTSASFKAASTKCRSVLRSALPRPGKR